MTIPPAALERLTGTEPIGPWQGGERHSLLEFWQWACSDVLSNTMRGLLAEWLVGTALGVTDGWRTEWAAEDLRSPEGITIEVKSAAYVQAWAQRKPSSIRFGIAPTIKWDGATGTYGKQPERSAQVYVFCLLAERDPEKVDPLDTSQWEFLVLPSAVLDAEVPTQRTIGLSSLRRLGAVEVELGGLAGEIRSAAAG
jgi:hypothetical protein